MKKAPNCACLYQPYRFVVETPLKMTSLTVRDNPSQTFYVATSWIGFLALAFWLLGASSQFLQKLVRAATVHGYPLSTNNHGRKTRYLLSIVCSLGLFCLPFGL
jgi:hypothetical protein